MMAFADSRHRASPALIPTKQTASPAVGRQNLPLAGSRDSHGSHGSLTSRQPLLGSSETARPHCRHYDSIFSPPSAQSRSTGQQIRLCSPTSAAEMAFGSSTKLERPVKLLGAYRSSRVQSLQSIDALRTQHPKLQLALQLKRILDGKPAMHVLPPNPQYCSTKPAKSSPEASGSATRRDGILGLGFRPMRR